MNLLITHYSLVTQIKSVYRVLFFVLVRGIYWGLNLGLPAKLGYSSSPNA